MQFLNPKALGATLNSLNVCNSSLKLNQDLIRFWGKVSFKRSRICIWLNEQSAWFALLELDNVLCGKYILACNLVSSKCVY